MGQAERERQAQEKLAEQQSAVLAELMEQMIGDARPHATFKACPKCGIPAQQGFRKFYCPGYTRSLPTNVKQPCRREGEHLHCACQQCNFMWIEETFDADDRREQERREREGS